MAKKKSRVRVYSEGIAPVVTKAEVVAEEPQLSVDEIYKQLKAGLTVLLESKKPNQRRLLELVRLMGYYSTLYPELKAMTGPRVKQVQRHIATLLREALGGSCMNAHLLYQDIPKQDKPSKGPHMPCHRAYECYKCPTNQWLEFMQDHAQKQVAKEPVKEDKPIKVKSKKIHI